MQSKFFKASKTNNKALQVRNKNTQMIKSNNFSNQDYYSILKIERNATVEELKSAYRKLSLQYHPDKNKDFKAPAMFAAVSNAYQVLSNPDLRAQYDRELYYSLEASSLSALYSEAQLWDNSDQNLQTTIKEIHSTFMESLSMLSSLTRNQDNKRELPRPSISLATLMLISASFSFGTSIELIHENPYFVDNEANRPSMPSLRPLFASASYVDAYPQHSIFDTDEDSSDEEMEESRMQQRLF